MNKGDVLPPNNRVIVEIIVKIIMIPLFILTRIIILPFIILATSWIDVLFAMVFTPPIANDIIEKILVGIFTLLVGGNCILIYFMIVQ